MPVIQRGVKEVYDALPVSLSLGDQLRVQASRVPVDQSHHPVTRVVEEVRPGDTGRPALDLRKVHRLHARVGQNRSQPALR